MEDAPGRDDVSPLLTTPNSSISTPAALTFSSIPLLEPCIDMSYAQLATGSDSFPEVTPTEDDISPHQETATAISGNTLVMATINFEPLADVPEWL